MKKIITSYNKLPEEAQVAFDELHHTTDMQLISIPYKGNLTKGYLFAFNGIQYVVRQDEPVQVYQDMFKRELEKVEDAFDEDVFDEEEE